MTQDYGGQLRVLEGEFRDEGTLQNFLQRGIELPQNPPDALMLTEGMEKEILAVAIADVWGEKALDHEDGEVVTINEVRDFFAPRHNVGRRKISHVFDFLKYIGACDEEEENSYRFTRDHMEKLLEVESKVHERSVDEHLNGADQAALGDFTDPDEDAEDEEDDGEDEDSE
jgi:hypothetical protein